MADDVQLVNLIPGEWRYLGEGNKNVVLRIPKDRCVLRLIKDDFDESDESVFSHLKISLKYMKEVMTPLFGNDLVYKGELIRIIGKELEEVDIFRPDYRKFKKLNKCCLGIRLPDCTTRFPPKYDGIKKIGPVFAVELKPKMGFSPFNQNLQSNAICQYQLTQRRKLLEKRIEEISTYCPLDLFSGQVDRMKSALRSLMKNPQNNFRLFVDGKLVYGENMSESELENLLREMSTDGSSNLSANLLIDLVTSILLYKFGPDEGDIDWHKSEKCGCRVSQINANDGKGVFKQCVLGRILSAQKLGVPNKDLVITYEEIKMALKDFPLEKQIQLIYGLPSEDDELSMVSEEFKIKLNSISKFLAAATAKDCSIMLTIQKVEKSLKNESKYNLINNNGDNYAFNVTVLDLDMKPHSRIVQYCNNKVD